MSTTLRLASPPLAELLKSLLALVSSSSGNTRAVHSPLDGSLLADVPACSVVDVERAAARARSAQATWREVPLSKKSEILLRFHDLILERREDIIELIVAESGKSRTDAFDECVHLALTARYYARASAKHLKTSRRAGVVPFFTKVAVRYVPKGLVGVLSPWNYPFTMAMCDGLPAIMAGNAVLAKPDSQTPLTALLGLSLLRDAGLPDGVWQTLIGSGEELGGALIDEVDYVCFTGSTQTGKIIAERCAKNLIGSSLELGGKNPMLVLDNANVRVAAAGAVKGAFSNAGQLCVAIERIGVNEKIFDDFVNEFATRTRALNLVSPDDATCDMGSLISTSQLKTVQAHVDDAVAKGATVVAGGNHRPDIAPYYFEPTILTGVTPDMTCYAGETFGPLVSVYPVTDDAEAIAWANASEYGLNAAVYSSDLARGRHVAAQVRCGTVNVNEPYGATFGSIDAPMGGIGKSGTGRRQGAEGIRRYTDLQSVASQERLPLGRTRGTHPNAYIAQTVKSLRIMKLLGRA